MARYIDADALIKNIKRFYCTDCNNYNGIYCRACGTDDAMTMIDDAPTADVAPRAEVNKAYWEGVEYGNKDGAALVAREIFEEIRDLIRFTMEPYSTTLYAKIEFEKLEALKKKYTQSEPPKGD